MRSAWPETPDELAREQERLAALAPERWEPAAGGALRVGACAAVFGRAGADGAGWAAAIAMEGVEVVASAAHAAPIAAPFEPGLLALREGTLLEAVCRKLPLRPDVLLVAAAGRDHPRRAGLALHLGAVLEVPTVGVTDDPLAASGDDPGPEWAARATLELGGEGVGYRVRTRKGAKPIVAHAAWRTSPELAAEIALGATWLARWPEPLREARRLARELRDRGAGRRP